MSETSPLESIFFAALEKQAGADRCAFLDDACAVDGSLRHKVERMLAAECATALKLLHEKGG